MIITLDTETTGARPGQICQLSYILEDANGTRGKNFFFEVFYIDPSAQVVHGLSVEMLKELSGGKVFGDYSQEIFDDLNEAKLLVGHNFVFDYNFLQCEYLRLDRQFSCRSYIDTMREYTNICKLFRPHSGGYKFPRLEELSSFLGNSSEVVGDLCEAAFGEYKGYHDARFDAAATHLAVMRLGQYNEELKSYIDDCII